MSELHRLFPFVPSADEEIPDVPVTDLVDQNRELAKETLAVINSVKQSVHILDFSSPIVYYLTKTLADAANERKTIENLAESVKMTVIHTLKRTNNPIEIGNMIGLRAQATAQKTNLRFSVKIPMPVYLSVAGELTKEPAWKLVNRMLSSGFVFLSKDDLIRLVAERARQIVLTTIKMDEEEQACILALFDMEENEVHQSYEKHDVENIKEDNYPPCIKKILKKIRSYENLRHTERLHITNFLLSVGVKPEDVTTLFSDLPDFDEAKTKYFVNHSKTHNYTSYGCRKAETLNICPCRPQPNEYQDEWCFRTRQTYKKAVGHPLEYVKLAMYAETKKKQVTNNRMIG